ncbi:hypothetical protein GCM10010503_41640 [Streptomyces lucensis JCM 4490]|uniref:Uncharacterized protein n=1 Tax=Streptomyces lucensis JCM 4490 TaxID=1306176 RepID=A0A918J8C0_9ACTN|nr:hypothetical protein GCM10010503_41640 [Streptomyces lucensis JCM 4490]
MILLFLALLGVTGCTDVTPGSPTADGRPPGVRGPLAPDGPLPTASAPTAPPSAHSALVRTGPDRPERTAKAGHTHRRRTPATARQPQAAGPRPRPAPPSRPGPQRRAHPHKDSHPGTRHRAVPALPVRPPQPYPQQMRRLCHSADGVADPDIAGLCHQAWG